MSVKDVRVQIPPAVPLLKRKVDFFQKAIIVFTMTELPQQEEVGTERLDSLDLRSFHDGESFPENIEWGMINREDPETPDNAYITNFARVLDGLKHIERLPIDIKLAISACIADIGARKCLCVREIVAKPGENINITWSDGTSSSFGPEDILRYHLPSLAGYQDQQYDEAMAKSPHEALLAMALFPRNGRSFDVAHGAACDHLSICDSTQGGNRILMFFPLDRLSLESGETALLGWISSFREIMKKIAQKKMSLRERPRPSFSLFGPKLTPSAEESELPNLEELERSISRLMYDVLWIILSARREEEKLRRIPSAFIRACRQCERTAEKLSVLPLPKEE